jgi:F-type H+-transporting ATPase subunit b
MERLLQPDTGLMVWTFVTFLVLVWVLGKFAWKPLLQALNQRESGIRRAVEDAQAARQSAEQMKQQYEKELAEAQEKVRQLIAQGQTEAQRTRERLVKDAEEEARRIAASARQELEREKARLVRDLRKDVANLSLLAAEKLVRHSVNQKVNDQVLQDFFSDLDKQAPG